MDSQATQITPSPAARKLFGLMVARQDSSHHIGLAQTIGLGVHRMRQGRDPLALKDVRELEEAGWIEPHPDGGWGFTGTD